jgi:hypothetical protein
MRCNYGAEMMVVNAECLVSLSVGHVTKFPVDSLCRRVPKRLNSPGAVGAAIPQGHRRVAATSIVSLQ